jgi:hypothetical protein
VSHLTWNAPRQQRANYREMSQSQRRTQPSKWVLSYVGHCIHSFASGPTVLAMTLAASHGSFLSIFRHLIEFLWKSDQPVAKASIYTGQHNTETRGQHICLKRNSNPRSQPASEQGLHLRPGGHWDRHIMYTGCIKYNLIKINKILHDTRTATKITYVIYNRTMFKMVRLLSCLIN